MVYVASCLANDIPARLLGTGYVIPGKVDHAWQKLILPKMEKLGFT